MERLRPTSHNNKQTWTRSFRSFFSSFFVMTVFSVVVPSTFFLPAMIDERWCAWDGREVRLIEIDWFRSEESVPF